MGMYNDDFAFVACKQLNANIGSFLTNVALANLRLFPLNQTSGFLTFGRQAFNCTQEMKSAIFIDV